MKARNAAPGVRPQAYSNAAHMSAGGLMISARV